MVTYSDYTTVHADMADVAGLPLKAKIRMTHIYKLPYYCLYSSFSDTAHNESALNYCIICSQWVGIFQPTSSIIAYESAFFCIFSKYPITAHNKSQYLLKMFKKRFY